MSEPRVHGGIADSELARLGLRRDAVLDLSINVNPWGPHPDVVAAIRGAALERYPQLTAASARRALARSIGADAEELTIGHGSTELIWSAIALLRGTGRPLLTVSPTFSEPSVAARAHGVPVVELRTRAEADFALDLEALSHAIVQQDAAGIYLCQPNNPDGGLLPAALLRELCAQHPTRLFVLDQAFLSLSTRHADAALRFPDNVLIVRSLTKEHALPGLRVGYALGAPSLLARLDALRPSWMVSTLAEAAVVAACEQTDYVTRVREALLEGKAALAEACRELGLHIVPSSAPYFMTRVPDADLLRERLLARHRIAVRSCSSFGLPNYIRLAGCSEPDRTRVLAALAAELP